MWAPCCVPVLYKSGAFLDRIKDGAKECRGFSLAETLMTVALVVILLGLAVVGIFNLYWSLQQKELDSKAEIIYVTAQNQMTKVMAAGRESYFQTSDANGVGKIEGRPYDDEEEKTTENQTYFITSDDFQAAKQAGTVNAATVLFGEGGLDEELLNGSWAIEYDRKSLTVYAAYYCGDSTRGFAAAYKEQVNVAGSLINRDRYPDLRLKQLKGGELPVGYHGGASSTDFGDPMQIQGFSLAVENTEKLTAQIKCRQPGVDNHLAFELLLEDGEGNTYKEFHSYRGEKLTAAEMGGDYECKDDILLGDNFDGVWYTLDLTLDSLEGDGSKRFSKLYGSQATINTLKNDNKHLVEGSSLKITVRPFCPGNSLVTAPDQTPSAMTNSLFADETEVPGATAADRTIKAHIKYGRHLQNLDSSSHVSDRVSSAVVDSSIDFSRDSSDAMEGAGKNETWLGTYGGSSGYFNGQDSSTALKKPHFKSLANDKLIAFDGGTASVISSLYVNEEGSGTSGVGLFAHSAESFVVSNLRLENPSVSSAYSSTIGFVVGSATNTLKLENCQVYLGKETALKKSHKSASITGAAQSYVAVGGLVGFVSKDTTISNCSVSMVMGSPKPSKAEGKVGGLVGSVAGGSKLTIDRSYCDSYLYGQNAGGLVASAEPGSAVTISNSYAAGYVSAVDCAAGFVAKGSANVSRSYSICTQLPAKETGYDKPKKFYTTVPSGELDKVFYFPVADAVSQSASQSIGGDTKQDREKLLAALNDGAAAPAFEINSLDSQAYNLLNQSLSTYAWPKLPALYHYGDWEAEFKEASLVYFEHYEIGSGKSKRTVYRVEGGGIKDKPLIDDSYGKDLNGDKKKVRVVGDGYGLVYNKETGSNAFDDTVKLYSPTADSETATPVFEQVVHVDGGKAAGSIKVDDKYVIYPLDLNEVNNINIAEKAALNGVFRLKATVNDSIAYLFNPHFARTVLELEGGSAKDPAPDYVYIRTARQLFNLSKYYSFYSDKTKTATFAQQRNIDYKQYLWKQYYCNNESGYTVNDSAQDMADASAKVIVAQEPIGRSANTPFVAKYDGGCHEITNVGFVAATSSYAGMFGSVGKEASVSNVFLCAQYDAAADATNYYVNCKENSGFGAKFNLGVLAGENKGAIKNCSVSGYYVAGKKGMVLAYANSTLKIGGLVGSNAGTVVNCSADFPKMTLSVTNAKTYAGGFVGSNERGGKVKNCYAIGVIDIAQAKGGTTAVAGFAGTNSGQLKSSYCATALASAGDGITSYGFSPKAGSVSSCTYLWNGSYSFIGNMYAYFSDTTITAGTNVTYQAMSKVSAANRVSKDNTFKFGNTVTATQAFPYRGVVKNAHGELVYYGDWQDDVRMGDIGVFYWEHEQGGSNAGYHMTYLGDEVTGSGENQTVTHVQNSSLCTAHNDGGVIDSYGYGIYVQKGTQGQVTGEWSDIACSSSAATGGSDVFNLADVQGTMVNAEASEGLREQMAASEDGSKRFLFYAFTTRTAAAAAGGDYIALDNSKDPDKTEDVQNGTLKLKYKNGLTCEYTISPFFANALQAKDSKGNGERKVTASDGTVTDYSKLPGRVKDGSNGKSDNAYEIRSVDQLQYINWNNKMKSATEKVDYKAASGGNWKDFNYLLYASSDKINSSPKRVGNAAITAADIVGNEKVEARKNLCWVQTHDVEQTYESAEAEPSSYFAPIAGTAVTSTNKNAYDTKLPTWFGGHYDGQSYTLKNLAVKSSSFNVGVFGTTVSAVIKNVIMYGNDVVHAVVERTDAAVGSVPANTTAGAYSIGGLIGLAYDYDVAKAGESDQVISNCAISGYRVVDSSSVPQRLGEANVGGLIGVCAINLQRCSSTANIVLRSTHQMGSAYYGLYIRAGGLTGAAQGSISDSYTGGSVTVDYSADARSGINWDGLSGGSTNRYYRVFVGGISGSAFTARYDNFIVSGGDAYDSSPVFNNCYTYMSFPSKKTKQGFESMSKEGSQLCELALYAIGSVADRVAASAGPRAIINNCFYYLDDPSRVTDNPENLSSYLDVRKGCDIYASYNIALTYSGSKYKVKRRDAATTGSSLVNPADKTGTPKLLTYEQLSDKVSGIAGSSDKRLIVDYLNKGAADGPWGTVTVKDENGGDIPGKFSLAASEQLDGKDYPFPTVIKQNDLTFGSVANPVYVNVHYGDWPLTGISHWDGPASFDIFENIETGADGSVASDAAAFGSYTLHLDKDYLGNSASSTPAVGDFEFRDEGAAFKATSKYVSVESVAPVVDASGRATACTVKFKALDVGTTVVRFKGKGSKDTGFTLTVTANGLNVAAEHGKGTLGTYDSTNGNVLTLDKTSASDKGRAVMNFTALAGTGSKAIDFTKRVSWDSSVDKEDILTLEGFDGSNKSSLQLKRNKSGRVVVAVTATYVYKPGVAGKAVELASVPMHLTVAETGVMGLSTLPVEESSGQNVFDEVSLGKSGDLTGSSKSYGKSDEEAPAYENLFLYSSLGNEVLTSTAVDKVEIGGKSYQLGVFKKGDAYYVSANGFASSDDSYSYLGLTVVRVAKAASADAEVKVTLTQGGRTVTLKKKLKSQAIPDADTVVVSLAREGASKPYELSVPVNCMFALPTESDLAALGIDSYVFDGWSLDGEFYSAGDTLAVGDADLSLAYCEKYRLTMVVGKNEKVSQLDLRVGRKGLDAIEDGLRNHSASAYESTVEKWFKDNKRALAGWYEDADANSGALIDADGKFCPGAVGKSCAVSADGRLYLSEDTQLYAGFEVWEKASELTAGGKYLIAEADSLKADGKLRLAKADKAKSTVRTELNKPVYGVKSTEVELSKLADSSKATCVADRVDKACIWEALDIGKQPSSTEFFSYLKNVGTGYFLADVDKSAGSHWYQACIEDPDDVGDAPGSAGMGGFAHARSFYALNADGKLVGTNRSSAYAGRYAISFAYGIASSPSCLYIDSRYSPHYSANLYAQKLVFDNPITTKGGGTSGK